VSQQSVGDKYRDTTFNTLKDAFFYEIAYEKYLSRWQTFDTIITIAMLITTTISAITGWILWREDAWKSVWAFFAGGAMLGSWIHLGLGVGGRIKELEDLRSTFSGLRYGLERLLTKIEVDKLQGKFDVNQISGQLSELQVKLSTCVERKCPIISGNMRRKALAELNKRLSEEGLRRWI
jgi:hypothetical protein